MKAKDNREQFDITELNIEIAKTVERIDKLRTDIDAIIKQIER